MTTQEFIDAIKGMTVLELNDLVKACEVYLHRLTVPCGTSLTKQKSSPSSGTSNVFIAAKQPYDIAA